VGSAVSGCGKKESVPLRGPRDTGPGAERVSGPESCPAAFSTFLLFLFPFFSIFALKFA
jgi:hypothetical protein